MGNPDRRHGRRKRKKFQGNQHTRAKQSEADQVTVETSQLQQSADDTVEQHDEPAEVFEDSDQSMAEDSDSDEDADDDAAAGNRIINLSCLQDTISAAAVPCQFCEEGNLSLVEVSRYGLATECALRCNACASSESSPLSLKKTGQKWYEINRRSVLAMRLVGQGRESLKKVCATLDLPPPLAKKSFDFHRSALRQSTETLAQESMSRWSADLLSLRTSSHAVNPADVVVSTDGTWMRRGYSSLYGVQTVISLETKKILDVEILSKSCARCRSWKSRLEKRKVSKEEYDAWAAGHAGECHINTHVSSPAMESSAVVSLWARSQQLRGLRYVGYIGDGDSKGFRNVLQSKPYGDQDVIKECVGHVQKRLGKSLRDLKQRLAGQKLADGKRLGGKGRMTDFLMNSLQTYYGIAIRENTGDVQAMYKAIWASFCHSSSSDEKPMHQFCPPGLTSWCKWQQHEAGSPEPYKHHDPIPPAVFDVMKPIYVRLTDRPLLERCLRGATQNINEAFNNMIWSMCPKVSFCSVETLQTAVHLAILQFNDGYKHMDAVLEELKCNPQSASSSPFASWDVEKEYHATRKAGEQEKRSRKRRRAVKKGLIDDTRHREDTEYEPGGF